MAPGNGAKLEEKRDRLRVEMTRSAFVMKEPGSQFAYLLDISAGGARLELDYLVAARPHSFHAGEVVRVLIDGFDPLEALIVRTNEDQLGLRFLVDDREEKRVLAEIMAAVNDLNLKRLNTFSAP